MATVDVIKCCLDSIRQISENINDAIVYLDVGSTESFQFLGAFPLFLELRARAVCSLENISALEKVVDWHTNSKPARKIVIITLRLLSDAHRYILRCLSTFQTVHHCAIYTSISEHHFQAEDDLIMYAAEVQKVRNPDDLVKLGVLLREVLITLDLSLG